MTALYKVRLHCITHTNTASYAAASSDSDLVAEPRSSEELSALDKSVVTVPCCSTTPSPEFESKFMNINKINYMIFAIVLQVKMKLMLLTTTMFKVHKVQFSKTFTIKLTVMQRTNKCRHRQCISFSRQSLLSSET